jgi:hypothetical protein
MYEIGKIQKEKVKVADSYSETSQLPEIVRLEDQVQLELSNLKDSRILLFNLASRIDHFRDGSEGEEDKLNKGFSDETHTGRLNNLLYQLRNENLELSKIISHLKDLI